MLLRLNRKARLLPARAYGRRGQATAEMAIMGTVVMMLLAYLLQQGYFHNARQALEMYTFREALRISKQGVRGNLPVGITLTVVRDAVTPSFFSGIAQQRMMSSASVDFNPWIVYTANETQDMGTRQLFQIGERMIRRGLFFEVPPTQVKVETNENDDPEWMWVNSAIRDITAPGDKTLSYSYLTNTQETATDKTITKDHMARSSNPLGIRFENQTRVVNSYIDDDWTTSGDDDHIVSMAASQVPGDLELKLIETLIKAKTTTTPH